MWACCRHWPRTLVDKWNGREFAARHGCPLPQLYWYGTDVRRVPWDALPDEFVIKPRFGAGTQGVMAVRAGRDELRDEPASISPRPSASRLRRAAGRPDPVLIEEFVMTDGHRLPLEYKCHTFGSQVRAIELVQRTSAIHGPHRVYLPSWEPLSDPFWTEEVEVEQDPVLRPAPPFLSELVSVASRMGATIGTYMRIDFFAAGSGFVFNEFSSMPQRGLGVTPYADELFGAAWQTACADRT